MFCTPQLNIFSVIKYRIMRRTVRLAFTGLKRNAYRVLMMKPDGSKQSERQRHRWENNIKMDIQETGWEVLDRIDLAQCDFRLPQRCKRDLRSSYRRFGKSYQSHVQGAKLSIASSRLLPEDGNDRLSRNVGNNNLRCVAFLTAWVCKIGAIGRPEMSVKTNLRCLTSLTALVSKMGAIELNICGSVHHAYQ